MTAEEITNAFNMMSGQLQQVQTALAAEQVTTAELRQSMNRGGDSGIIGAIRSGQMKQVSPKEVHQHASVWLLQVVGLRHERLPLLA